MEQVYYPRVRSVIKPGPTPPDILNTEFYQGTRVLLEQGRASGFPTRLLDLDVDWEIVRQEINGTRRPAAIIGETWYGINSGAKSSLDRNYLALAEQTGRVTIAPLHSVTSIAENPGGGYRVFCNEIDEGGQVVMSKSFTCRLLFLAAGSIGTSALLVRAKGQGTLPNLNNSIGQGWAGNGDHLGLLFNLPPTSINPPGGQGGPSGAVIQNFTNPFNPVSLMNLAQWNANSSLLGLGIGIPVNRGGFSYDPSTDSVVLNWPNSANAEYVKSMYQTLEILNESNTSSTRNPFSVVLTNTTAHPLGGAVMGQTCDLDGRVIGYSGLYVVDGALIPGSAAACNPSLTIAAIAERCMDRIRPELAVVNR
jgi:cholesterol oxidase